jgi:hypothetical protein
VEGGGETVNRTDVETEVMPQQISGLQVEHHCYMKSNSTCSVTHALSNFHNITSFESLIGLSQILRPTP